MGLGVDLFPDLFDFAVAADQEAAARDAHVLFAVHRFFDPDAIGLDQGAFGVGQQWKAQAVFVGEFTVTGHRVHADAEHGNPEFVELRQVRLYAAGLHSTARCGIFRVEVDQVTFAFQGLGILNRTGLVGQGEMRSGCAGSQHGSSFAV